jgi:hypothetical protein
VFEVAVADEPTEHFALLDCAMLTERAFSIGDVNGITSVKLLRFDPAVVSHHAVVSGQP